MVKNTISNSIVNKITNLKDGEIEFDGCKGKIIKSDVSTHILFYKDNNRFASLYMYKNIIFNTANELFLDKFLTT